MRGDDRQDGCSAYRRKGPRACPNKAVMWVHDANDAVLGAVEQLLTPDVVELIIERTQARLTDVGAAERQQALAREREKLQQELANFVNAVAAGGADLQALTSAIRQRELRCQEIDAELRLRHTAIDRLEIDKALRQRLKDWRGLLRKRQEQGRQVLQKLIVDRLVFTPQDDGMFAFRGTGTLKGLLFDGRISGLKCLQHQVASPSIPSWNQIAGFLESMRRLRDSTGFAA